jgi:hypothetical protein
MPIDALYDQESDVVFLWNLPAELGQSTEDCLKDIFSGLIAMGYSNLADPFFSELLRLRVLGFPNPVRPD